MPLKAILFDAVGTLLYAAPDIATVYAATGKRYGSQLNRDQVMARFRAAFRRVFAVQGKGQRPAAHEQDRRRWREVVAEVFADVTEPDMLFEELWQHFAEPSSWQLFPDVTPAWRQCQQRGLLVGVASNYDDRLLSVVRGHDLLAECEHVFHSAGIGFAKPDRRFFRAIERRLELGPSEILLVGDDWENDYRGALAAGWQAIYLDRAGEHTGQCNTLNVALSQSWFQVPDDT